MRITAAKQRQGSHVLERHLARTGRAHLLSDAPASPSRTHVGAPFRYRDFRLLWSGMTVSLIGDGFFLVALAWEVYRLSNAPIALSLVGAAMTGPHVVFLLFGGAMSDRIDRRRLMVVSDAIRGTMIATLGVLSVTGTIRLWHFLPLLAVYGGASAFFGPAFDAIVPDVVPSDLLIQANAAGQVVRPAALRIVGPAIGGLVIALWGSGAAFLFDAGTFAIGIACFTLLGSRPVHEANSSSVLADIKEGCAFVRRHTWIWGTFLAAAIVFLLFVGPTEVLVPFIVKNELGGSAGTLGLVFAVGGFGAITAALVVGHLGLPRRHMTFMYVAWTLSMLAIAGYGFVRAPWQAMAVCLVFSAFESISNIAWYTMRQRFVPRNMLGRVSSLDWFIAMGLVPISFALTGPVVALVGVRATLIGAGVLGAAVTVGFLHLPGMRVTERRMSLNVVGPMRAGHGIADTGGRPGRYGRAMPKELADQIFACAIAYPTLGPRSIARALRDPQLGGWVVSESAVYNLLRSRGLSRSADRISTRRRSIELSDPDELLARSA